MNGFNDLKEKLEAQGIAVNSSANSGKNGGVAGISKNNSPSGAKSVTKKAESNEEKESRLKAELADFLRGSDIFKNPTNA